MTELFFYRLQLMIPPVFASANHKKFREVQYLRADGGLFLMFFTKRQELKHNVLKS